MGRGRKEEERLERIKTFLMQNEILKSRPALRCEGHTNSFTRRWWNAASPAGVS